MRIALVHYRAGLMDGVSLEMEKWKKVLERMGNDVDIIAGNRSIKVDKVIESIDFNDENYKIIRWNAFGGLKDLTKSELLELIQIEKDRILRDLEDTLPEYDLIIPNNILSLGVHLPAVLAFTEYVENEKEKFFIGHHHDFWWEREYLREASIPEISEILERYCPPEFDNMKHVVINSIAQEELKKRKGLDSFVVPNVMDFSLYHRYNLEELNSEIRKEFNVGRGTIVVLQATRIIPRKAIELSVDLVREMKKLSGDFVGKRLYNGEIFDGRIILAFSGMCENETVEYKERILKKAMDESVDILDMYTAVEDGKWDFMELYGIADLVTYPSILEGWGNQLLEVILFKKPVVLFEYEVFKRDIKKYGLKYVSLGDEYEMVDGFVRIKDDLIERAVHEVMEILFDPKKYEEYVEKNFEIGRREFSLEKLEELLKSILDVSDR